MTGADNSPSPKSPSKKTLSQTAREFLLAEDTGVNRLDFLVDDAQVSRERTSREARQPTSTSLSLEGLHRGLEAFALAQSLLGEHPYVTVELPRHPEDENAVTVHITRSGEQEDTLAVHVVSDAFNPEGARYTDLQSRAFLHSTDSSIVSGLSEDPEDNLLQFLQRAHQFVQERMGATHVIHVERQGYFEHPRRADFGLTDTGGETLYVFKAAETSVRMGCASTVITHAGPNHPTNNDVRAGMHYKRNKVDILFVPDEEGNFVRKEDTYPTYDFRESVELGEAEVVSPGIYDELAKNAARLLQGRRVDAIIGHYIDGAVVATRFWEIREQEGESNPEMKIPTAPAFLVHSLSAMKERRLRSTGEEPEAWHNLQARKETEAQLLGLRDKKTGNQLVTVFVVSKEIEDSIINDYGAKVSNFAPAGVDFRTFCPREPGVTITDRQYDKVWTMLARERRRRLGQKLIDQSGNEVDNPGAISMRRLKSILRDDLTELQKRPMVFEASRPVKTKGKLTIVKAFAHLLEDIPEGKPKPLLVINLLDPNNPGKMSEEEVEHARKIYDFIEEKGLWGDIISKTSFNLEEEVAPLNQLASVYLTAPEMETWGMSVQQAAMCKNIIVSSTTVPLAEEVLRGKNAQKMSFHSAEGEHEYYIGEAAMLFPQHDHIAAGEALKRIFYHKDQDWRLKLRQMRTEAYAKANNYTWENVVEETLEELGLSFALDRESGKRIKPTNPGTLEEKTE